MKRLVTSVMFLFATLVSVPVHAFPIALPGSEGLSVVVTSTDPVLATYQGNSAAYSNDLFLLLNGAGVPGDDGLTDNDLFLFNNLTSAVGSSVNLGSFEAGTELIFRLYVNDTGETFFTGPASRNPDGLPHARVQSGWMEDEALVSFEDLYGTPEGVNGFNDLSFSFTNTSAVPEPALMSLLGVAAATTAWRARRRASRA